MLPVALFETIAAVSNCIQTGKSTPGQSWRTGLATHDTAVRGVVSTAHEEWVRLGPFLVCRKPRCPLPTTDDGLDCHSQADWLMMGHLKSGSQYITTQTPTT